MKPISLIWIATAALTATLALTGCKNRKEEPIPGPKATLSTAAATQDSANRPDSAAAPQNTSAPRGESSSHHGASGISWFQGTLDEAFSSTCHKCASMFRR